MKHLWKLSHLHRTKKQTVLKSGPSSESTIFKYPQNQVFYYGRTDISDQNQIYFYPHKSVIISLLFRHVEELLTMQTSHTLISSFLLSSRIHRIALFNFQKLSFLGHPCNLTEVVSGTVQGLSSLPKH